MKTNPEHTAGFSYTYNLTVGKDKVVVGSVTVSEWTDGITIIEDAEIPPFSGVNCYMIGTWRYGEYRY